jgi:hypothetical protein
LLQLRGRVARAVDGEPKKYTARLPHARRPRFATGLFKLRDARGWLEQRGVGVGVVLSFDQRPGGWVPSRESDSSRSEQVKQCMDLAHFIH